jgi:predicted esterase
MQILSIPNGTGPHRNQVALKRGADLGEAKAALILVHGRGASASDILQLADDLFPERLPASVFWIAPQANNFSWYPYSFLEPLERNQPHLDSALSVLDSITTQLTTPGIPYENQYLLGFSQGACLVLEFAARAARKSRLFGGVFGMSGGLIGPPGGLGAYSGTLQNTPVFLGCSSTDPHIPAWRVEESALIFRELGADVTARLYPGLGHTINQDELDFVRSVLAGVA